MRIRIAILSLALLGVLFFLTAPAAWSQPAVAADGPVGAELRYFDFFVVKGGWIAYLIILISVVMLALAIEHSITIRRATILPPETVAQAREQMERGQYLEAVQLAAANPSMFAYCLHAGLIEASNGFEAMERAVEEALEERSARFFRKIEFLNIIGNVSPMIGLFGTVYGMILLFAEIHAADGLPGARIVADRMGIALITTFWGLAVAIPALSIYALFRNRVDVLAAECALAVDRILAVFGPGGGPAAYASAEEKAASKAIPAGPSIAPPPVVTSSPAAIGYPPATASRQPVSETS